MTTRTELQDVEKIIVLDYGSQYNQLISRRIREIGVFLSSRATRLLQTRSVLSSLSGLSFPAVRILYMKTALLILTRKFLSWESRFWVFAMVCSF